MNTYLSIAHDVSEEAGQSTLDQLGLNRTFRWNSVRDMPRDQFAVRGSKILQHAVGSHGRELARMVLEATDPANPRSSKSLARDIRRRWDILTRSQAERIARTETATIWETTNWNTMRANGIQKVEWTIAHGPNIGPPRSYPVCPLCLREAAGSPYPIEGVSIPPKHPNCRCTLIPVLDGWLPPAETWSGGPEPPLPLHPASAE
jgi:SPP1 gp7 family putative phage head morphogenesis protein